MKTQISFGTRFILLTLASLAVVIFMNPEIARAQSEGGTRDFSLFVGYMLPDHIDGVTEILPLFGGRYTYGWPAGAIEFSLENSQAEGVSWTSFGMSLRGEAPLAHGISALLYGGPSFHYFRPAGDTVRHGDVGVHFGIAGLMLISDTLWLRSDLKYLGGPGSALYLNIGFMFRSLGGG